MNKRKRKRKVNMNRLLRYLTVLFLALAVLLSALILTDPAVAEKRVRTAAVPLDEAAVASLQSLQNRDVGEVVQALTSESERRAESVRESIRESESVEQSIALSSMMEESSIALSEYESSVQESSSIAEAEALQAPLQGSHLRAREVVYDLDDSDIPYLRRLFSHCIVIGNSRAKNAVDCGIMTGNEVLYQSGQSVEQIADFAVSCAGLYKPKTLFILGLNDVAYYDRDYERYKSDYTNMIRRYLQINPTSEIYCMESLPLPEEAWNYFYRAMTSLGDFNDAVKRMCEENGWHYVSASDYADFSFINSEDHAHYNKDFYFLWAQTMASQMHLWEDEAGLGYEIPYTLPTEETKEAETVIETEAANE